MADKLAAPHGLPVGHSTGANVAGAVKLAERAQKERGGGCVVTIACDRSDRYFAPMKWERRYAWGCKHDDPRMVAWWREDPGGGARRGRTRRKGRLRPRR